MILTAPVFWACQPREDSEKGEPYKWLSVKTNAPSVAPEVGDFLQTLNGSLRLLYCKYDEAQLLNYHQLSGDPLFKIYRATGNLHYADLMNDIIHAHGESIRPGGYTMAIATLLLWGTNFLVSQTFPMMDGNSWLVAHFNHGFPFILYAVFCVLAVIFVWRLVPETKNKSLETIESMWKR